MPAPWLLLPLACEPDPTRPPPHSPPVPPPGTEGEGPTVEIRTSPGVRDLVAFADPADAALSWRSGDLTVEGDHVPARLVVPGERWEVTASADGREATASVLVPQPPGGNVLVLVLDDIGIDHLGVYGVGAAPPPTPHIDALAASGVRFDRAYASPVCTPTRGVLLTGRHARRTGMGWIADTGPRDGFLPFESTTVPEALRLARTGPWSDAALGKWHLAGPSAPIDLPRHPLDSGFSSFAGTIGNPLYAEGWGYQRWEQNVDGVIVEESGYLTSATIDDTLERASTLPEPWFLYVGLHAAHTPLSPPPPDLVSTPLAADADEQELFDATVEALDTELGRLFDELDPDLLARTTVVLVGDNGSPEHAVDPPLDPLHAKHTVYEGGVRVPLVVAGPHVAAPGSVSPALVHATDVFVLVAEIAGIPLTGPDDALAIDGPEVVPLDGGPLLPLLQDPHAPARDVVYAEGFHPNGPGPWSIDRRSVRDARWSLVRLSDGDHLFDLGPNPGLEEGPDLLVDPGPEALEAWGRLAARLDRFEAEVVYEGR